MGDSDDEYDRKRRDKFRGERSTGEGYRAERRDDRRPGIGGGGGGTGARDDWAERNPFRGGGGRPRTDYRDYRGPRDRYSSPGRDMPPVKRMRPDWGDDMRGAIPRYGYDPYLMHAWNEHYAHSLHSAYAHGGGGGGGHGHTRDQSNNPDMQTQPPMMTLKQFLDTQDDGISDAEVLRKYSEYKLEFKRQQLNEFFVAHKDEEWFKIKYHPVDSVSRKAEQLAFLKKRVEVFNEVLENGSIKSVTMDTSQTDALLRLLDTVVIKLEGGTDEDLKILDEKPKEPIQFPERSFQRKNQEQDDDVIITSVGKKVDGDTQEFEDRPRLVTPPPARQRTGSDDEENWDIDENESPAKAATPEAVKSEQMDDVEEANSTKQRKEKKSLKRKRTDSDSSSSSSNDSDSSSSSSSDEDEDFGKKYDVEDVKIEPKDEAEVPEKDSVNGEELKDTAPLANSAENVENDNVSAEKDETEDQAVDKPIKDEQTEQGNEVDDTPTEVGTAGSGENGNAAKTAADDNNDVEDVGDETTKREEVDNQPETIDLDKVKEGPQPRALHRTSSVFLRNLAPSITKAEIEAVCQNFDGYLRVAIADPSVERRWYRRGWVTFKRDVNIKEICWNLNNTRLRDCEMGAIVNRDLSRRVRPVNGMTAHKTIVRADIKLCAKIALNLDDKFKLWDDETSASSLPTGSATNGDSSKAVGGGNSSSTYGFNSNNPVLQNITDFLIEEASAEEEELLGLSRDGKDNEGETIERDPQLISVLDCLILYLRIVHSVDFYNHCEYPYEDEMPNRCGIIHARGPTPTRIEQHDLQDYIKNFESKVQPFLAKTITINDDELKNLGAKDTDAEVEKFIQANSQELAKDKWLCPLSGKKFKGPEFIRKHIFNKHQEKVEEVRKEVEFFNNYLKDPKRPQLPEHPGSSKRTNSESSGGGGGAAVGGYRPAAYPPPYAPPYGGYAPPMMLPGRGGRGYGGGRRELPMEHQRRIIGYHDLDAPANFDMFD